MFITPSPKLLKKSVTFELYDYDDEKVDTVPFLNKPFYIPIDDLHKSYYVLANELYTKYLLYNAYFYDLDTLPSRFEDVTTIVFEIELKESAEITTVECEQCRLYRTKDFIIKKEYPIRDFIEIHKLERKSVEALAANINFIKDQTYELFMLAVSKDANSIEYIKNQTEHSSGMVSVCLAIE